MAWFYLFIAGVLEVIWAVGLRHIALDSRSVLFALIIPVYLASIGFLGLAMREIPLGIAYPIWVAIGVIGTVLAGLVLFGEHLGPARMLCLLMILLGVLGLKLL